jgi:hypothetical protein
MKQMHAVVGFLPDAIAKALASKGYQESHLNVRMEHGSDEMHVTIHAADVLGVLSGASQKGETAVQIFVKDDARIDTVASSPVSDLLRPIRDLSFFRLRPPINVIYYDPRLVDKLVQLTHETLK